MLNAVGAIGGPTLGGTGLSELFVTSGSETNPTVTVSATTQSGGIALGSNSSMTILKAVAAGGPIDLESPLNDNTLTIAGSVATIDDGTGDGSITLVGFNLDVESGLVSSDDGAITLNPTVTMDIAAQATIRTSTTAGGMGTITIAPSSQPSPLLLLNIAGSVASSGNLTILGEGSNAMTTLIVSGQLASGGTLSITNPASTPADFTVYKISGKLRSDGDTIITADGPATINLNGALSVGGQTTIGDPATQNPVSITVNAPIVSTGPVTLNGTTSGDSVITIAAPITSAASIAIVGNGLTSTDTLELTTTTLGTLTAPTVTLTGGVGNDTFVLAGPITASAAGGININGGATVNAIKITGMMSAPAGTTTIDGGGASAVPAADFYVIAPSSASTFTFQNGGPAAQIQILTPSTSILSSPVVLDSTTHQNDTTGGQIVFQPATGYQSWTILVNAANTYTIQPTP